MPIPMFRRAAAAAVAVARALGGAGATIAAAGLAVVSAATLSPAVAASASPAPADRIWFGGPIVTVDDARPKAEAVAVRDGRIVHVGSKASAMRLRGASTELVDLKGRTLLPGFIDGHGHMSGVGLMAIAANLLPPPDGSNATIDAVLETLRAWMKTSPLPTRYGLILGWGYDDSQLKEGRHPTRDDLDRVSTEVPVYLMHISGHLGVVNSKGLEALGLDAATPDPEGGRIRRRDGSREPDGVLEETANFGAAMQLIFAKAGKAESEGMLLAGQQAYLSYGYTTAQEGAADRSQVDGYIAAAQAGRLLVDVVAYPSFVTADPKWFSGEWSGRRYRGGFRIGGLKITLDGSPQGRTAWLTQPYHQAPAGEKPGYAGYPAFPDAFVQKTIRQAFENGWQVLAHTNGDAALDQFLKAVELARTTVPGDRDRRPVAIHAQTARADQVDRMKALGVVPSFFPMHTYYWGDWHRDVTLGPVRAPDISPTGWALRRGLKFTSHHDAPVVFPNSMRVLASTVNRTTRSGKVLGPQQRVDPIVAIKAMTLWAAYQHFEESTKGSIQVGKIADFAILDGNPLTVPRATLADLKVTETVKAGRTVWTRGR
jgi:hypothetical protein